MLSKAMLVFIVDLVRHSKEINESIESNYPKCHGLHLSEKLIFQNTYSSKYQFRCLEEYGVFDLYSLGQNKKFDKKSITKW